MITSEHLLDLLTVEPSSPIPELPGSELLTGFWYPAALSKEVRPHRLSSITLLEIPMVVGRDDQGRAFALRDACPHRGMPLSFGHLEGATIECCYHGWRFDTATGQCCNIPCLPSDAKLKIERIHATRFACEEGDGYLWIFIPGPGASTPPPAPELPTFSDSYRMSHLSADLPCNVDNGIIGLMDPAHGPFVHQAWWWRNRRSIQEKEKVFEPIPNGFRIRAHEPSANSAPYKILKFYDHPVTSTIEFVLPNMRLEQVRCGPYWFSSRATVTPLKRDQCRIDFCAAWNILPRMPFAVSIFRIFARKFIKQDQLTMQKQAIGLKHSPGMMLIDDADRPARWYFQLKSAYLESASTGRPMEHPLRGPVTLRWRS